MENNNVLKEEIRKEFQIERMILFSDAVFAIVITLMAIEIKAPEITITNVEVFMEELNHVIPSVLAYVISFIFIGNIWYQHLKLFALVKDFDKGLVIRNLLLLFFISLFPFSAAVVTKSNNQYLGPMVLYFIMFVMGRIAQLFLQHYILIQRPQLRHEHGLKEEMNRFKESKITMVVMLIVFGMVATIYTLIPNQNQKSLAWTCFAVMPILLKFLKKKYKIA